MSKEPKKHTKIEHYWINNIHILNISRVEFYLFYVSKKLPSLE